LGWSGASGVGWAPAPYDPAHPPRKLVGGLHQRVRAKRRLPHICDELGARSANQLTLNSLCFSPPPQAVPPMCAAFQ